MLHRRSFLGAAIAAITDHPAQDAYQRLRAELAAERATLRRWLRWCGPRPWVQERADRLLATSVLRLTQVWLGTTWGLGRPQIERPGGRVNCGTFVGRLLADAGFVVPVFKLQQQASAVIAGAFAGPDQLRRYSRVPIDRFIASVAELGPGVSIIGLDYHVGLLVRADGNTGLRYLHSSIETGTVVDEPAATARTIRDSAYRVVGKTLGPRNLRQWLLGLPIAI